MKSWHGFSAKRDIEAPDEICYQLWLDRELVPAWMPWIDSVKVILLLFMTTVDDFRF